jgi:hypothetical protein
MNYAYDNRGNNTAWTMVRPDGSRRRSGWHQASIRFNADNFRMESHVMGKPEHYVVYTRDSLNRKTSIEHLNKNRKPKSLRINYVRVDDPGRSGWYKVELVYDLHGHHSHDRYFSKKGKLKKTVDCGTARCWSVY